MIDGGFTDSSYNEHVFFNELLPALALHNSGVVGTANFDEEEVVAALCCYKNNAVVRMLLNVVTLFTPKKYWRGIMKEIRKEIEAQVEA